MEIPKARELYQGDINKAVVAVQEATGVKITSDWWDKNVGNEGSAKEILDRFDKAYTEYVASQT